ncbi:conserved membrane protein of unknown function [Candidatus Saccharimonas aalborgensis]|uniref:Glycosyltransferase RgtA/B/C/D-like domain-containing protein n=1 Tax=Candidatus Saccharimonas aalborgensis TaxID=1332188 RepID=R4PLV7_9BACT|nr:glycosyltransferase family 39 protein [Candidatus Saccharimonas aalborgensis]AGL62633.1 conserved membrane protein of unknown function [Candidatus Saccharimonas aalborgensis]QQR51403.1 MAG: glycosyltransferase family 39 protein [Candidatus Saccharibacteria bacterium]
MRVRVTDFLIYRWRYIVSYGFLIVCVGVVLFIASFYVPGELREAELTSSVQSGSLSIKSLSPSMVIDLPYHVLQRVIFNIFGVSTFTIKLPSLILGVGTVLGLFLLLSTWFRRNVAVFGTIIAVTSTQFLFLVQDGTPGIMHTFVAVWLLFAATYVTRQKLFGTLWKVITLVLIGTALYLPLGSYLVLAILTTSLFHPHIRHIIKRFSRLRFILAIVLGCIAITPLIYASILDPGVARTLLGIPDHSIDFWRNTTQVGTDISGFASQSTGALVRPLYSLSIVLLAGIGLYKLITYKYTARSYITMVWGALLIPLIILNPERVTETFPLAALLMSLGIATLISDWYKLFPRNPYARVAGLIPLTIVIIGIMSLSVLRYIGNYQYNSSILSFYSKDLTLLQRQLTNLKSTSSNTILYAGPSEAAFYTLVAHYDKRFSVDRSFTASNQIVIVAHDARTHIPPRTELKEIVTNSRATDGNRFYIYQTPSK